MPVLTVREINPSNSLLWHVVEPPSLKAVHSLGCLTAGSAVIKQGVKFSRGVKFSLLARKSNHIVSAAFLGLIFGKEARKAVFPEHRHIT